MKHLKGLSKTPEMAQSGLCTSITGNSQAILCFVLEVLTLFALPVLESGILKDQDDRGTDTIPLGGGEEA